MSIKKLLKELEKKKKEVEEIQAKIAKEVDKTEWIKVPELGIEIQKNIHHEDKSYNKIVSEFGKEYVEGSLPTYSQLQFLRNSEIYKEILGLIDTWELIKQEDIISKNNGYVARFCADSDGVSVFTNGDASYSTSYLGVRFVRKLRSKK